MKGSEPPRIKVKPQNTNTMENKTYFSIEIYDGITITGKNPYEVKKYLYDMHSGFCQLADYYFNNNMKTLFETTQDQMQMIGKAIYTINNNLKH